MPATSSTELTQAQRRVLADILRSQPSATLGELGSILQGQLGSMLKSLTIADLLGTDEPSRRGRPRAANTGRRGGSPRSGAQGADRGDVQVNSRTAAGRRRYDAAVLSALRSAGRPLSAGELRRMVGGSDQQIRVSLKRLVLEDGVIRTGVARGTRYHV